MDLQKYDNIQVLHTPETSDIANRKGEVVEPNVNGYVLVKLEGEDFTRQLSRANIVFLFDK